MGEFPLSTASTARCPPTGHDRLLQLAAQFQPELFLDQVEKLTVSDVRDAFPRGT